MGLSFRGLTQLPHLLMTAFILSFLEGEHICLYTVDTEVGDFKSTQRFTLPIRQWLGSIA